MSDAPTGSAIPPGNAQSAGTSVPQRPPFPLVRLFYSIGYGFIAWFVLHVVFVLAVVQFVVIGLVPDVADVKAPVAQAFGTLLGRPGVVLASLAAMVSIYGYSTGTTLQSPRLLFSMAERGELPRVFARVHERFRTPHVAILAYALAALGLALYGSFTWNATLSAIVRLLTYGLTCVALLVFRRRPALPEPGFRVPAATVIVPLAAGFCLWLLATRSLSQAWITAALVGAGALLFLLRRRV